MKWFAASFSIEHVAEHGSGLTAFLLVHCWRATLIAQFSKSRKGLLPVIGFSPPSLQETSHIVTVRFSIVNRFYLRRGENEAIVPYMMLRNRAPPEAAKVGPKRPGLKTILHLVNMKAWL